MFKDEFRRVSPELSFLGESVGEIFNNLILLAMLIECDEFSSSPSLSKKIFFLF